MNKILSTWAASGQPFQAPLHLDFLQNSFAEAFNNTAISLIGETYDPTIVYRLWGAQLTSTGGDNYTNTAGAVFFNGEIYTINVVGGLGTSMPDGIKMVVVVGSTDATDFVDGSIHAVNQTRRMAYANDPIGAFTLPTEIRINTTISSPASINSDVISFTNNQCKIYSAAASGSVVVNIDFTESSAGAEIVLQTALSSVSGISFVYAGGSMATPIIVSANPPSGASTYLTLKLKYQGKIGAMNYFTVEEFST